MEEWKFIICRVQTCGIDLSCHGVPTHSTISNGSCDWPNAFSIENVALLLARIIGPDNTLPLLKECGFTEELSESLVRVFEILRVAEKRQRAMIQCMLEKCERFLWS